MNQKHGKFTTRDIVMIGLMSAIVFVTTAFLKIEIPTPTGPTMLKVGNIFCLLAGILFGATPGGLAAGIGSMLFDLTNPAFAKDAIWTLVRFFLMGWMCGKIAHWGAHKGESWRLNLIGSCSGALFSLLFYIVKSVWGLVLQGSTLSAAIAACTVKMITGGINAVIAVVAVMVIAPACRKALMRAGFLDKRETSTT